MIFATIVFASFNWAVTLGLSLGACADDVLGITKHRSTEPDHRVRFLYSCQALLLHSNFTKFLDEYNFHRDNSDCYFFAGPASLAAGTQTLSAAAISKSAAVVEILTRCKPALPLGIAPKTR